MLATAELATSLLSSGNGLPPAVVQGFASIALGFDAAVIAITSPTAAIELAPDTATIVLT